MGCHQRQNFRSDYASGLRQDCGVLRSLMRRRVARHGILSEIRRNSRVLAWNKFFSEDG
jgi:hypothetical protein